MPSIAPGASKDERPRCGRAVALRGSPKRRAPPATTATPLRGGDGDKQVLPVLRLAEALDTVSHPRGVFRPSFAWSSYPQMKEGAGKTGCRPGTHGPLCERWQQESAQRHTGEAKHPAFPAQWLYGLCRALLGERCTLAPVALRLTMRAPGRAATSPQRLTPACGRQDHTILPYADHTGRACDVPRSRFPALRSPSHQCGPRPPPSRPAFVTIAIRPSSLGRSEATHTSFPNFCKVEYFWS